MDPCNDRIRTARLPDAAALAEPPRATGLGAALLAAAAAWSRERGLARMWVRANLARVGPHEFYPAVGCRTIKDQRVYEYPL